MEKISKTHEKYKYAKDLIKSNKHKELTITDDIQVLKIVDKFNLEIELLLYSYEEEYQETTQILLNSLISKANEVYEISNQSYQALAIKDNHAGIIAVVKIPQYTYDDFKEKDFLFVLDKLEIPGNLGTIYRTLDSINADGVILIDSIAKQNSHNVTQSARGCNLTIPTICSNYEEALAFLQNNDYEIFLGEPELGKSYQEYQYSNKIAIVVGNERFGINPDWYNHKNTKVFIPMEGNQNSLNVGVAASILAYEAYMKRKGSKTN